MAAAGTGGGVWEDRPAIVLDNGGGVVKIGFAEEELPKCVVPNVVGRHKYSRIMPGGDLEGDLFVGTTALKNRGALRLQSPMEHGCVTSWDDMLEVWRHALGPEGINTDPKERPMLITEPPLNPGSNSNKMLEVLFETLGVPAVYVSQPATLSLLASGRTTGVVLDCGDGVSHAVPVLQGRAITHAACRSDVAGADVTNRLQMLLRMDGYPLVSSGERDIAREVKEAVCRAALDPRAAEEDERAGRAERREYTLPDGRTIQVGAAAFRAPEVLFQPMLVGRECPGVHELVSSAVYAADVDARRDLWGGVVLSGGSTATRGFAQRMLQELRSLAPKQTKIRIAAPQNRKLTTWVGGSILASLSSFSDMWVTAAEYKERG